MATIESVSLQTKDGVEIKTGRGYNPPGLKQPMQVVGLPFEWIFLNGDWKRLDLYCDRVRSLYREAIVLIGDLTFCEFKELIGECLE